MTLPTTSMGLASNSSAPPAPFPSLPFPRTAVCLHLVSSLLRFQLLSSVEGVEEAVVVQESRSGGGAAPPLPPYPNIGELNLDGKTAIS